MYKTQPSGIVEAQPQSQKSLCGDSPAASKYITGAAGTCLWPNGGSYTSIFVYLIIETLWTDVQNRRALSDVLSDDHHGTSRLTRPSVAFDQSGE